MADKIASGAWHEGGPPSGDPRPPHDDGDTGGRGPQHHEPHDGDDPRPLTPEERAKRQQADKLRTRRDNARWSAVVGFALMFGASFHSAFLFGGVAMVLYGATASVWWSVQLRKVEGDPWAYDPDLDGPGAPDWARK